MSIGQSKAINHSWTALTGHELESNRIVIATYCHSTKIVTSITHVSMTDVTFVCEISISEIYGTFQYFFLKIHLIFVNFVIIG